MAGFDKFLMAEKLKERGWVEIERSGLVRPPKDLADRLGGMAFHVYEARDLHCIITGEDLDDGEDDAALEADRNALLRYYHKVQVVAGIGGTLGPDNPEKYWILADAFQAFLDARADLAGYFRQAGLDAIPIPGSDQPEA